MADFAYSPDFQYKVNPDHNVLISEFENGYEQRRLKHENKIRTFDLSFKARTNTEFAAVLSFFDTKKGALTAFTMDLDGSTITGRLVPGSFVYTLRAYHIYDYAFRFREVL